ncbi:MAG: addiction module protein [Gammaproteobacteria bacterium]
MPSTLEALQGEVLRLSPADRARLLDRLIASLDADADVEAAWDQLADAREKELEAGSVQAIPVELVVARLEARFQG